MGTPLAHAQENSIEIYDENLGRHTVLTRSARMRKFRFYQYKPIHESPTNQKETTVTEIDAISPTKSSDPQVAGSTLSTRDNVLQGKVALLPGQSQELIDLDNMIDTLEKQISDLNTSNSHDAHHLDKIFKLVSKKNDLIRRQMQLNIIEQEKVLEKANEELTKELRSLMSIDDSKKTDAQLERQQYLYNQSLALVNKRNELVHHMDVQEQGIEDDNELKARLKNAISDTTNQSEMSFSAQNQNCIIQ